MTEKWTYERRRRLSRFVLGAVGINPLVWVGIKPSTAKPGALDNTAKEVTNFAANVGPPTRWATKPVLRS